MKVWQESERQGLLLLAATVLSSVGVVLAVQTASLYLIVAIVAVPLTLFVWSVAAQIINGKSDFLLMLWLLLYPLGYYFLSYPRGNKTIVSFDRVVVCLLALAFIINSTRPWPRMPRELISSAKLWAWFLLAAGIPLLVGFEPDHLHFTYLRIFVTAFVMPAVVAAVVIWNFRVRENLARLHTIACVTIIYIAAIAVAEVATGRDLLPILNDMKGMYAGAGEIYILRANGPFLTSTTLTCMGLVMFLFLQFLRAVLPTEISAERRWLHRAGLLGAALSALSTMHRGTVITGAVLAVMQMVANKTWRWRYVSVPAVLIITVVVVRMLPKDLYEERVSSPGNVYARLAQNVQNFRVFIHHPVIGVGVGNFGEFVSSHAGYMTYLDNGQAMNVPHNDWGSVLTETGLLGFFGYLGSQIFLFLTARRIRLVAARGPAVRCYLTSIILAYVMMGMNTAQGYYGELNIFYMFVVAVCLKYALTEPERFRPIVRHLSKRAEQPA
jgi:O-antigen ligase